jgi:hypothetical protein
MRTILMLLMLVISASCSPKVRRVSGVWEGTNELWQFTKDSLTDINKTTGRIVKCGYGLEREGGETRLILFVSKDRPELGVKLELGIPFALLRYDESDLLVKLVDTEGISVVDYALFPWPEFGEPYKRLRRPEAQKNERISPSRRAGSSL